MLAKPLFQTWGMCQGPRLWVTVKGMLELVTNAPSSWPKVVVESIPPNQPSTAYKLLFATAAETCFRGSKVEVLQADVVRITYGGALEVPLRVRTPDGDYDLFFYPEATGQAAAHFRILQRLAELSSRLRPVFYCPQDVREIPHVPIEPIARRDKLFVTASLYPPAGQYGMWWADQEGERFEFSRSYEFYDQIYYELNNLEMHGLGLILLELQMIQHMEELTFMELGNQRIEIPLEGPEGVPIIITFTQERGLRFHFHMRYANAEYRDLFLNHYLNRVRLWKKGRRDEAAANFEPSSAFLWWKDLSRRLQETQESVAVVGSVRR